MQMGSATLKRFLFSFRTPESSVWKTLVVQLMYIQWGSGNKSLNETREVCFSHPSIVSRCAYEDYSYRFLQLQKP